MIWREKERSRVRAVQLDDLGFRRMDKVPNAQIRQLMKRLMKVFSDGSAMWRG